MATITGLTAGRMQDIIDNEIVDADVINNHLILTKQDGSTIDAGSVLATAPPLVDTLAELQTEEAKGIDGHQVFYAISSAIVWNLRYDLTLDRWHKIGGPELFGRDDLQGGSPGTGSGDTAWHTTTDQGGPTIILPLGGKYKIQLGCQGHFNTTAMTMYYSFRVQGAQNPAIEANDNDAALARLQSGHTPDTGVSPIIERTVVAGAELASRWRDNAGSTGGFISHRWMRVDPEYIIT